MRKGDKGNKVFGVIVILAIVVSVFGGAVSAEDLSRGLKQSVADAGIQTAVGNLSSEELTKALDAVTMRPVNIEFADQSAERGVLSSRSSYDPQAAVNYAEAWWNGRNSNEPNSCDPYKDYGGYDCANFVSQCLKAGGLDLSAGTVDSCGCIISCTKLNESLVNQGAERVPWLKGHDPIEPYSFRPGDPAIFGYTDNEGDVHLYAHSVIAVTGDDTHYTTCNAHSSNAHYERIQDFYDANPSFDRCTFYHIPVSQPPIAHASDISNQPDVMHPDTLYEVTAKYYDPDGRTNLYLCTLGLAHPSDDIMMGWGEDLKMPIETSAFINDGDLAVDYTQITDSYEGYQLTWKFKLNDQWPEAENCIDFGVLARDDDELQSEYDPDNTDASFVVNQLPQVTTNAATNVEETTAILNGVISSDGGEACQYRFEYDTNSGEPYAYNTGWTGSKTTGQSFSASIPRLNKGTKYYFRAQAKNSAGTASGSELTFLTKPDAPTSFSATTAGTTQIDLSWTKGTGAQKTKIQRKQGSYPANKDDGTQVYFGSGTSKPDTGLTPGTTYCYGAWSYVQGSEQWSDNSIQASATTTSIGAPTVTTNAASGVGTTSATLNGNLDDTGGESCQVWFEYGKTTSYGYSTSPESKSSTCSFSKGISGLDDDTTYHFRAVASNSAGTAFGDDKMFKTDKEIDPPQVTTNAATNVEETTATLNGVITNDGGEACQYRFEYDTNPGEPYAHNTGWTGSKTTGQSFSASIPSLNKGTKYYFRAQAKNSAGAASGSELTFLTKPDAPTSFSATTAGTTQIDLSWTKGTGAQKTKIQRKQGSYPSNKDDGTQVYFGTGSSTPNTGLTEGTTYYYRAWSYVQGSEQWSDNSAQASATTTSIGAPTVTTNAESGVGTTSATLNGNLDDTGGESCQVWFEYGKTTSYGSSTSPESKSSTGSFSKGISGLDDDTTYHFRAVALNSKGTVYGLDNTFKTEKETYPELSYSAVFRNGWWYADTNGDHKTDTYRKYGIRGDKPVVGDIDNNGINDMVAFRNGWWYVAKEDHTGTDVAKSFKYGIAGDTPLIGDIDNNGVEDAVIYRNGWWYVAKEDHTGTDVAKTFKYGISGDIPLIGDIDNNGVVDAVIYRNGWWYVAKEDHTGTDVTKTFKYGISVDKPILDDIRNDGSIDTAVLRNGWWFVSKMDHSGTDYGFKYGIRGDVPIQNKFV